MSHRYDMMVSNSNDSQKPMKCNVCRVEVADRSQLYQVDRNLSVVCPDCYNKFSEEELGIMTDLFIAFGGYFGMLESEPFLAEDIIEICIKESDSTDKPLDIDQINTIILHKALLHGRTHKQYINELKMQIT